MDQNSSKYIHSIACTYQHLSACICKYTCRVYLFLVRGWTEDGVVHASVRSEQDQAGAVLVQAAHGEQALGEQLKIALCDDVGLVRGVRGAGDCQRLPVLQVDEGPVFHHLRRPRPLSYRYGLPSLDLVIQSNHIAVVNSVPERRGLPIHSYAAVVDGLVSCSPRQTKQTLINSDTLVTACRLTRRRSTRTKIMSSLLRYICF
jgi:hypothetical protein